MKKFFLPILLLAAAVTGCKKAGESCDTVNVMATPAEVTTLEKYITDHGIYAVKDLRGFFYSISDSGTGARPTICSTVTVNYSGELSTGSEFDAASQVSFNLGQLITGWQEGIPLIAKGGSIVLYLPPSLAYGSQTNGSIPANSILIFHIQLTDVR